MFENKWLQTAWGFRNTLRLSRYAAKFSCQHEVTPWGVRKTQIICTITWCPRHALLTLLFLLPITALSRFLQTLADDKRRVMVWHQGLYGRCRRLAFPTFSAVLSFERCKDVWGRRITHSWTSRIHTHPCKLHDRAQQRYLHFTLSQPENHIPLEGLPRHLILTSDVFGAHTLGELPSYAIYASASRAHLRCCLKALFIYPEHVACWTVLLTHPLLLSSDCTLSEGNKLLSTHVYCDPNVPARLQNTLSTFPPGTLFLLKIFLLLFFVFIVLFPFFSYCRQIETFFYWVTASLFKDLFYFGSLSFLLSLS